VNELAVNITISRPTTRAAHRVLADQQHRRTAVARGHDLGVDLRHRCEVETSRVGAISTSTSPPSSRCYTARWTLPLKREIGVSGVRVLTCRARSFARRLCGTRHDEPPAANGKGRAVEFPEPICRDAHAAAQAFFNGSSAARTSCAAHFLAAGVIESPTTRISPLSASPVQPAPRRDCAAVAGDAAIANDLAARNRRDTSWTDRAGVIECTEFFQLQPGTPTSPTRAAARQLLRPDHGARHVIGREVGDAARPASCPAQNGDLVGKAITSRICA